MQIKTVLLPVAAALSLAACGQPTANSAGSDQKTSADSRGSVSWAKKLGSSKSAKANVSFPAAGMIVQAIYEGEDYATTGNWMRTLAAKYGGDVSDTLYGDDEALNQLIKQLRESLPELAPPAMRPTLLLGTSLLRCHFALVALQRLSECRGLGLGTADEYATIHFILDLPRPGFGGGLPIERPTLRRIAAATDFDLPAHDRKGGVLVLVARYNGCHKEAPW